MKASTVSAKDKWLATQLGKKRWLRQLLHGRKWSASPPLRLGKYCRECQLEMIVDCWKVAYGSARLCVVYGAEAAASE